MRVGKITMWTSLWRTLAGLGFLVSIEVHANPVTLGPGIGEMPVWIFYLTGIIAVALSLFLLHKLSLKKKTKKVYLLLPVASVVIYFSLLLVGIVALVILFYGFMFIYGFLV